MAREPEIQQLIEHFDRWSETAGPSGATNGGAYSMSQELYPFERLFSPITINHTTLKNRIVMAPMGNIDMCEETGRPNEVMLEYFFERAKGGAGLLTTGLIPVSHGLDATVTERGQLTYFPRIDRSRTVLAGWRDLAQGVHAHGAKIFIQLTAGLGRVGNPECLLSQKKFPQSASMNPNFYIERIPCLRMSDRKLKKIVARTGQAAADAKAMGLDGVYLHGHEGYLIEQMTNPAFNRRRMGRYRDYQRFGLDLVKTIRERVGDRFPIMYRIDLSLALEETYEDAVLDATYLKKFRGGRTMAQTLLYMQELVLAGVDVFDVDLGCYDNWWLPHPPSSMPAGCFLPVAQKVKAYFAAQKIRSNQGQEVPIVAVGKLGYPDLAESALREGSCDMVMLGRPLLADPEWPKKAYAGRTSDIRPCIGCQEGCLNEFVEGGHPQCAVNPRTGFESMFSQEVPVAREPRRIAVIGAGPGGVVAALTCARRGHRVELYEKEGEIGGRIRPGAVPRIKFDIENYKTYLNHQLERAIREEGLIFHPNTTATPETFLENPPDCIIVATGTKDLTIELPADGSLPGVQAPELFLHPEHLEGVQRVVIVGGGVVGCEMALWLSHEMGKEVQVVEMLPRFMQGTCTANRGHLLHALKAKNVGLLNMTRVIGLTFEGVRVLRNTHPNVPNPTNTWSPILPVNIPNPFEKKIPEGGQEEVLPCDLVVFAAGGRADASLYEQFVARRVAKEVHLIGDAFQAGRVQEAVRSAYRLARTL
ncbi:2,4-dienoyl-CoA reductase [NADPH] [Clostridiaceae bacterium JG1575]|nr:2,4-dienoyl-CoA reductase [NADPH] [Clostridiaceae bacterium JG1575]